MRPPRTHCRYGHELTPDNVYVTKVGTRSCRICRRATHDDWKVPKTKPRPAREDIKLYPFQQYTLDRFHDVRSVLIGDDMGLGKTIQAVALDRERRIRQPELTANGKTLVVAPIGVHSNWVDHFEKYTELTVTRINPRSRESFLEEVYLGTYDVYICHWEALRLMPELSERHWLHVVGDEVHKIQSRKTKVTQTFKEIPATFKTGLSGTPAFDKPDDLWSILNWLYPTFWTSYTAYFDRYVLWVDYNGYKTVIGVANEKELQEQMRGFYIRRLKTEVLTELPEKYYEKIYVDLHPKQRRAYNQMRDSMIAWVGENEDQPINTSIVLAQITRLQQFAAAYAYIETVTKNRLIEGVLTPVEERVLRLTDPSSKIDAALDIIYGAGNNQIVFFSQFSTVIDLFIERCKRQKISCVKYTGDTSNKDREKAKLGFAKGEFQVIALTIRSGGTALDELKVASTGVFFDRDWSASNNNQAEDRLWRMGQKNAVQIIDLVAANTVERARLDKVEMSWALIKQLLGDEYNE